MELFVHERLTLIDMLPATGDMASLRIARKLREKLSLNDEELSVYEVKALAVCKKDNEEMELDVPVVVIPNCPMCDVPMQLTATRWNAALDGGAEIDLTKKEVNIITLALNTLNTNKTLQTKHLTLCDKFIPED